MDDGRRMEAGDFLLLAIDQPPMTLLGDCLPWMLMIESVKYIATFRVLSKLML